MADNSLKNINNELVNVNTDLKAEFIAMELIQKGVSRDIIFFSPQGIFRRSYRKDIDDILIETSEPELLERIFFRIHREGIYDTLPEGLFHKQLRKKTIQSSEEVIEEIRQHRKEQTAARKFFLPLDNEFMRQRLLLEDEERRGAVEFLMTQDIESFFNFSEIFNELTEKQLEYLVQLLPMLHDLRGDLDAAAYYFSCILEENIKISPVRYIDTHFSIDEIISLRDMQLGYTTLIGNDMQESVPTLKFTIGPLSNVMLEMYLYEGTKSKVFHFLCDLLLPAEYEIIQALIVKDEDRNFIIGDVQTPSFLGYNVYL